jgi:hypothetical protein
MLELNPTGGFGHYGLGLALLAQDRPAVALAEMEQELDSSMRLTGMSLALNRLGRKSEADAALAVAEEKYGDGSAYQIALTYADCNDADRAFAWLERAYRQHDDGLSLVKNDPLLKNIKHDPRYKDFLRKMKLPE